MGRAGIFGQNSRFVYEKAKLRQPGGILYMPGFSLCGWISSRWELPGPSGASDRAGTNPSGHTRCSIARAPAARSRLLAQPLSIVFSRIVPAVARASSVPWQPSVRSRSNSRYRKRRQPTAEAGCWPDSEYSSRPPAIEHLLLEHVFHFSTSTVPLFVEPRRLKALPVLLYFEACGRQVRDDETGIFAFGHHCRLCAITRRGRLQLSGSDTQTR